MPSQSRVRGVSPPPLLELTIGEALVSMHQGVRWCIRARTSIRPCPLEIVRKAIDRMHMTDIGIAYGMTETSPVRMQTRVDDVIEWRVSTVGRV